MEDWFKVFLLMLGLALFLMITGHWHLNLKIDLRRNKRKVKHRLQVCFDSDENKFRFL